MNAARMAEWPHEVHPNRRDHTAALGGKIDAMSDIERLHLLHWLCGYTPASVEVAVQRASERPWAE